LGDGAIKVGKCKEAIDKFFWFDAPRAVKKKMEETINKLQKDK
jgi:hypothetical protein